MPYNLLILPLMGGYFVLTQFLFFKHTYSKLTSQQLLFSSIFAGILILIFSFLLRNLIEHFNPVLIVYWYKKLNSFKIGRDTNNRYLWTLCAGLIATVILTIFGNLIVIIIEKIFKKEFHLIYAINNHGSELEKLFLKSAQDEGYLIQITLKNDKVYIGGLAGFREPKNIAYLKFRPLYSGYRDSKTKLLSITTDYNSAREYYEALSAAGRKDALEKVEDIVIIIKVDEILSVNPFDPDIFIAFKKQQEENQEKNRTSNSPSKWKKSLLKFLYNILH